MQIGVFDSGIGGEAVAVRLRELLPQARVLTAHDHHNVPYGSRSEDEVYRLTKRAIQPLLGSSCEAIVLACNTATAAAIDRLRADYPRTPFVGLEPMVKPASTMSESKTIVVCATPATLRSQRYQRLKTDWASALTVLEPDCSEWAATIEARRPDEVNLEPVTRAVQQQAADVIVLACTHYHWIKPQVELAVGAQVRVLEPSDAIAAQIRRITDVAQSTSAPSRP
ncbi:aspartate/glutamate racemase family protein [Nesterenkonia haasae]|uniref:aspartate/glutamate racemase family protein n=1 Tax=Nesterenkonia haasae TaxID=2587813 RepID=UPI001391AED1|nr:aspartate/glutamate racemase family protein [Nesterenkonia haasae]NDK31521.1 glutamate racemase [Nesterenkonia haasae]